MGTDIITVPIMIIGKEDEVNTLDGIAGWERKARWTFCFHTDIVEMVPRIHKFKPSLRARRGRYNTRFGFGCNCIIVDGCLSAIISIGGSRGTGSGLVKSVLQQCNRRFVGLSIEITSKNLHP
jgi:hypothetical protein